MSLLNDAKVDRLIDEIEIRPALYNKNLRGYSDNALKKKLWLEVCEVVLEDWNEKTEIQKFEVGKEVQDKWRGLRSCFSRELRDQKNCKNGQAACKRRKYIYFDRLSFLMPHTKPRFTASNLQESGEEEESEYHENSIQLKSEPGTEILENPTTQAFVSVEPNSLENGIKKLIDRGKQIKKGQRAEKNSSEGHMPPRLSTETFEPNFFETQVLDILGQKQLTGTDEDITFAISLVPFLKRISEDKKIDARIEILRVLRRFTNSQSS